MIFSQINPYEDLINNTIFITYNEKHYASCFYIGKGLFITNKHFFNNYELDDEIIIVKNRKFKFECKKIYIPKNNMDLALLGVGTLKETERLTPIKISKQAIHILYKILCFGYSYFDYVNVIRDLKYPNIAKGVISKILKYKESDIVYQVDCSCYSGGSGGPIVNEQNELVGVLFQNLTFHTNENFVQLPNSGYIIGRDIIKVIVDHVNRCIDSKYQFDKLWIFNVPSEILDLYLNYKVFKPKF